MRSHEHINKLQGMEHEFGYISDRVCIGIRDCTSLYRCALAMSMSILNQPELIKLEWKTYLDNGIVLESIEI